MTSIANKIKLYHKYKIRKKLLDTVIKKRLKKKDFAIVSNNCWGGSFYQALNLPYNTPFVGLFINSPCYIKLLKDFWAFMDSEINFIKSSKYGHYNNIPYPIGLLKDEVELHFLHYRSEEEARQKWNRRKEKLPRNESNLFFKFDDRDFCSEELVKEFHELPYEHKVSFTKRKYVTSAENIVLKNPNGFILFDSTFDHFDPIKWLNTGRVGNSFLHSSLTKLVSYPVKFN